MTQGGGDRWQIPDEGTSEEGGGPEGLSGISGVHLRGALDAMRDPFLLGVSIRAGDGAITGFRIVFANRAAVVLMGRMPDVLTGASGPHTMPYQGVTPLFDAFRHVVETGETWAADAVEFMLPAAGGTKRRGVVNIQVARSGDGFFATFQDLSERELARREREHLAMAL